MHRNWILAALVAATVATAAVAAQPEEEEQLVEAAEKKTSKIHPNVLEKSNDEWVSVIIELQDPELEDRGESGVRDLTPRQQQVAKERANDVRAALKGARHKFLDFEIDQFIAADVEPYALHILDRHPHVKAVTLNHRFTIFLSESVPMINGGSTVIPAGATGLGQYPVIIDSGIRKTHQFLLNKVKFEACFSFNGNCPNGQTSMIGTGAGVDCPFIDSFNSCWHGTHVAGIVAGKASTATGPRNGVAPDANLISIQVFSNVNGQVTTAMTDLTKALTHVLTLSATVKIPSVNMSIGAKNIGYDDQRACDVEFKSMKVVIDKLRTKGIMTVIASGNSASTLSALRTKIAPPACISTAVSVGSVNDLGVVSAFTQGGSSLSLYGPGENIMSSVPGPVPFRPYNGTSMAAPHVAGAVAGMKQVNPTASVAQILNALGTTGVGTMDTRSGTLNRIGCRIVVSKARVSIPPSFRTLTKVVNGGATWISNCGKIAGYQYEPNLGFITDSTDKTITLVKYPGPYEAGVEEYYQTDLRTGDNRGFTIGNWCCGHYGELSYQRSQSGNIASLPKWNYVHGTNDFGDKVGLYWATEGFGQNYKLVNGSLSSLQGVMWPQDINNMRRYIGSGGQHQDQGLLINGSTKTFFDPVGSQWTVPTSINEASAIIGCFQDANYKWKGFKRTGDGVIQSYSIPVSAGYVCPMAHNDSYQIVGEYGATGSYPVKAFIDLRW